MDPKISLNNLRDFYTAYKQKINYSLLGVVLIVAGTYYYIEVYQKNREAKAQENIFIAQRYFKADSFELALNGRGSAKGLLSIIKDYSGTKAGNLAIYYAGIIYLKTNRFQKAIEMLERFSTKSNLLNGYSKGALADAYSEIKNYDKALKNYKSAANILKDDNVWGAENLLKACMLLELQNKETEAVAMYKKLKEFFPESTQSQIALKSLYRLGQSIE